MVTGSGSDPIPTSDDGARPFARLEQRLGHQFSDARLCEAALTHKSWVNEAPRSGRGNNERLEFLGDAVVTLAVSDLLMKRSPNASEGDLSKTRAVVVSETGLARVAEQLDLGEWVFLGRGEEQAGGRSRPSILANALEALLGAVFLDAGFTVGRAVVERLFGTALAGAEDGLQRDFKSRLQERAQALLQQAPRYVVIGQEGPDHDKTFRVSISLGGEELGQASGKSKKEAEQNAAALALEKLEGRTA
ncbi:MAG TPA: ribonuclease III, partial [Polyangia bacterium]|jgi:ribonuclease-3|nr:ribonuclease III [Polyangia bacterium]